MGARGICERGGGPGIAGGAKLSSPGRRRGERCVAGALERGPGKLTSLGWQRPGCVPAQAPERRARVARGRAAGGGAGGGRRARRPRGSAPAARTCAFLRRLVVGAPTADWLANASVVHPGAIYKCQIGQNPNRTCQQLQLGE